MWSYISKTIYLSNLLYRKYTWALEPYRSTRIICQNLSFRLYITNNVTYTHSISNVNMIGYFYFLENWIMFFNCTDISPQYEP